MKSYEKEYRHCLENSNKMELVDKIIYDEKEIERLKEQLNDEIDDGLKQSEIMVMKQKEIERLNNIINELEKWFEDMNLESLSTFDEYDLGQYSAYKNVINKLQELKGSDK